LVDHNAYTQKAYSDVIDSNDISKISLLKSDISL